MLSLFIPANVSQIISAILMATTPAEKEYLLI